MFTGMYPVGMNVPLKTNRANKYAHVPVCRERVWRTVCSVCAYGARVVHHLPFLRVSTGTVICCFNSLCTGMYPVGMNVPLKTNRANKYAHVPCVMSVFGARSAVFARTGRVLSITSQATRNFIVLEGIHRHRNLLFQLDVHWNVPGWYECSTENKPCKQVCARTPVS